MRRMCEPTEVALTPLNEGESTFIAPSGWIMDQVNFIIEKLANEDTPSERVPPMALVRCSRGGKTRALTEIAFALKEKMPECVVLSVSFNAFSCVKDWEQEDPIGALCRRIAFAAVLSKPGSQLKESDYNRHVATMNVKPADILSWLKHNPCILIIDELNLLNVLQGNASAEEFAAFLKINFLMEANR